MRVNIEFLYHFELPFGIKKIRALIVIPDVDKGDRQRNDRHLNYIEFV